VKLTSREITNAPDISFLSLSLSLSLSCNLPRYVASRINQPAPAVHKLAVWVEASLSSLHFAKLTCTKSLPHYWRTRVRRPRCPRIWESGIFFLLSVRPLRFLSIRLESADVNATIRPSVRAWLSRTPSPPFVLALCFSLFLLRYVCTLDPGLAHCSARSPAYLHTTYITLFRGREFVARSAVLVIVVVGTVGFSSLLSRDHRHIWKRNPEGIIFWICSNVGRVASQLKFDSKIQDITKFCLCNERKLIWF